MYLQGIPRKQVKSQAAQLLSRVKLTEAATVRSGAYSGGMKRRLSVAIAMLGAISWMRGMTQVGSGSDLKPESISHRMHSSLGHWSARPPSAGAALLSR